MRSIFSAGIIIIFYLLMVNCNNDHTGSVPGKNKKNADILARTFKTGDGWGYAVFVNDKLFIRQSFIPAIEGNKGFAKEEDAIKIATLVTAKLSRHEKPTISLAELQQCGLAK